MKKTDTQILITDSQKIHFLTNLENKRKKFRITSIKNTISCKTLHSGFYSLERTIKISIVSILEK